MMIVFGINQAVAQNIMLSQVLTAVLLTSLITLAHSGSFTSGGSASYNYEPYTFTGSGSDTFLLVELDFNPAAPPSFSTLLIANTTSLTPSTTVSDYRHINPTDFTQFDYQNANLGRKQTVQLSGLTAGQTVHIYIVNFYTNDTYSYTITHTERNARDNFCVQAGAVASSTNIYCDNCGSTDKQGAYCKQTPTEISVDSQFLWTIDSGEYLPLIIDRSQNKLSVQFLSNTTGTTVFFDFLTFDGEMAGWLNHVTDGRTRMQAGVQYTTGVTNPNNKLLIGVLNQNPSKIAFVIRYSATQSQVSILVIVLGVLGGILLIALIIAAIFIIKRMSNEEAQVHPRPVIPREQRLKGPENLSPQQIEQYFPSVTFQSLKHHDEQNSAADLEPSMSNLKDTIDRDCVICLNPIEDTEKMKVTYCKHIFHDHCLVQWFAKQRNCPYCRQEYGKKETVEHYQKVLKDNGKSFLMGVELARAIFKAKLVSSKIEIQDIKDD